MSFKENIEMKQVPVDLQADYGGSTVSETDSPAKEKSSKWENFVDGFRRQEVIKGEEGKNLNKGISRRHLTLMALVTGIGTGLLVGSGKVLHYSGPLFLIIGYAIVGSFVYPTLQAAGELAVNYSELSGGYNNYPRKFLDESIAFAVSWNYCIQWLSVIAVELVTAAMTIKYWTTKVNPDVWVIIFYIVILLINFVGSKGYGEGEFVFGCLKLCMIVGFILMGIIVDLGGGPVGFIGGRYWHNPGAATNFKGLCSVFVTGSFALGQSEFVALSAAEQPKPRQAIPSACKLIFWRILIFYLVSLTVVGLLVPYDSTRLMGSSGGSSSHASPYVLAAALHKVKAVPSIVNSVILLSVTSVASSALYSSSRTLQSLAEQGFAPSYFNYIDKTGRPLRALVICSVIGIFSFIAAYKNEEDVFTWLLSISGLSQIFTWDAIVMSHIRFRAALKYNGISLDSLGYVSPLGVWGSIYAATWHWLVLIGQFWIALYPVGASKPDAENFFQNYLGAIFLITFYLGHKIYTKNWKLYIKTSDIDINIDRVIFDEEILNLEKQELAEKLKYGPWYKKLVHFLFE